MGQEASAEKFDDFFLVICKGSKPSVLADPALFLTEKFKNGLTFSFLQIALNGTERKCANIICKTSPNVNPKQQSKKTEPQNMRSVL